MSGDRREPGNSGRRTDHGSCWEDFDGAMGDGSWWTATAPAPSTPPHRRRGGTARVILPRWATGIASVRADDPSVVASVASVSTQGVTSELAWQGEYVRGRCGVRSGVSQLRVYHPPVPLPIIAEHVVHPVRVVLHEFGPWLWRGRLRRQRTLCCGSECVLLGWCGLGQESGDALQRPNVTVIVPRFMVFERAAVDVRDRVD